MCCRFWKMAGLVAFLLSGCAARPPAPPPQAAMRRMADADCGGPAIDMDDPNPQSTYTFGFSQAFWFRCESDGRVIGPYGYFPGRPPQQFLGLRDGRL